MLVILCGMGVKSCILTDRSDSEILQGIVDQQRSVQEMRLNQLREDMYNAQVKHERDVSLLKQRVEILEGKQLSTNQTVNVGNVNTMSK